MHSLNEPSKRTYSVRATKQKGTRCISPPTGKSSQPSTYSTCKRWAELSSSSAVGAGTAAR
ncbi:TPA: hypothetical protein N0F65_007597 [Lagenidium giganteum]|uniref:Uncharacterized protein n=1 Tax=Lagenidium giganteum TaxID=4803 RepID=A0AAV2ZSX8_9STRA|nr:TPA: hypothetical protein N0F65_007597 [Lagenidium giganteum]